MNAEERIASVPDGVELPDGPQRLVGIIENVGGAYLVGTQLKLTLALAVIACVLVLKPSGLLGRAVASRV